MRRFEEVTNTQLNEKLVAMRGTEYGEIICEWLFRYREGCRTELEELLDQPAAVTLNQGRIDTIKELLKLLTPPPHPVPLKRA